MSKTETHAPDWTPGGMDRIGTMLTGWPLPEQDLRRVLACLNACEGIPTEALENGAVADLRAACKLALQAIGTGDPALPIDALDHDAMTALLAAIAKAVQP